MSYMDISHLRPAKGNDIFLLRLAEQEGKRLATRLASHGVPAATCSRFERDAGTVLARAIHEDPGHVKADIDAVAKMAARPAIGGSKRDRIARDMRGGMIRAAGLIHDQSEPQAVVDPFADAIAVTPEAPSDSFEAA